MPDGINIQITGIKEVNRSLYRYSQALGDKAVIASLRQGAKVVQKDVKDRFKRGTTKRTGLLLRSVSVRKSKKYSKNRTPNTLGIYLTINDKKGFYGRFINDGWRTARGGHRVPGREYFSKAFIATRQAASDVIVRSVLAAERIIRAKTKGIR